MAISVKDVMKLSKTDLKTVSRLEEHFDHFLENEWRTPQSFLQIQESIKLKVQLELQKRYAKAGWTVSFYESTNNYNWLYTNTGGTALQTLLNSNVKSATNGSHGDVTIANAVDTSNVATNSSTPASTMSMISTGTTSSVNCYPFTYQRPTIHTTVSFTPTVKKTKTTKKVK